MSFTYTGDSATIMPLCNTANVASGITGPNNFPDAPMGTFVHWVVYDIPSTITEIKENFPKIPAGTDLRKRIFQNHSYPV